MIRMNQDSPISNTEEMAERKRSEVWLNFTRLDVDNARYQKCNESLTFKGGNTSSLSKHLAKVHPIQTEKFTVFDCLSSSSVAPSTSNVSTSGMFCILAATHRVNQLSPRPPVPGAKRNILQETASEGFLTFNKL